MNASQDHQAAQEASIKNALRKVDVSADSVLFGEKGEDLFTDICMEAKRVIEEKSSVIHFLSDDEEEVQSENRLRGHGPHPLSIFWVPGILVSGGALTQTAKAAALISALFIGQQFLDDEAPDAEDIPDVVSKVENQDDDGNARFAAANPVPKRQPFRRIEVSDPLWERYEDGDVRIVFRGKNLIVEEFEPLNVEIARLFGESKLRHIEDIILPPDLLANGLESRKLVTDVGNNRMTNFIPEPSSFGMIILGSFFLFLFRRRRT